MYLSPSIAEMELLTLQTHQLENVSVIRTIMNLIARNNVFVVIMEFVMMEKLEVETAPVYSAGSRMLLDLLILISVISVIVHVIVLDMALVKEILSVSFLGANVNPNIMEQIVQTNVTVLQPLPMI
jgi:hypothetical protein